MIKAGNRCELVGFDGANHGFYHREPFFTQTMKAADKFLASLGWLKGSAAPKETAPIENHSQHENITTRSQTP